MFNIAKESKIIMKIEAYSFGSMTVDGTVYRSDLIIFPRRISTNWWRKSGHSLSVEDLEEIVRYGPEVLVVGTGSAGIMTVPAFTRRYLEERGIELVVARTGEAGQTFNELAEAGRNVVGSFHLTC